MREPRPGPARFDADPGIGPRSSAQATTRTRRPYPPAPVRVIRLASYRFLNALHPAYKAHLAPMPDDLRPQIALIYQLLEAMCVPVLSKEGFEADDVIATVATAAARRGIDVFVCTTDKDCRQLIGDRVQL